MQPRTVVDGINDKDPEIQKWVYETFFTRILTRVKKVTNDSAFSPDITKDVFVVLFTRDKPFKTFRKIYEFAYRTATNKSIDHNKERDDLKNHEVDIIYHYQNIEKRNRANAEAEDRFSHLMYLAQEKLPRQCKQVFLAYYLYKMTNDAIAKKYGITIRTVETHKTKAYQILRIEVRKDGDRYIF